MNAIVLVWWLCKESKRMQNAKKVDCKSVDANSFSLCLFCAEVFSAYTWNTRRSRKKIMNHRRNEKKIDYSLVFFFYFFWTAFNNQEWNVLHKNLPSHHIRADQFNRTKNIIALWLVLNAHKLKYINRIKIAIEAKKKKETEWEGKWITISAD